MFAKLFDKNRANTTSVTQVAQAGGNSVIIQTAGSMTIGSESPRVDMMKKVDASRVSLEKKNLTGYRMAVRAYIDSSGSMSNFYSRGTVQELTERALGFALAIDDDGEIPVATFSWDHVHRADVNIENYQGVVNRKNFFDGGGTNLSASLADLLKVAKKLKKNDDPIYALIVTDGAPNDRADVAKRVKDLAEYKVFIKFLVVGTDSSAWSYVSGLDDMTTGRKIDNVDAQKVNNPASLTDAQFADIMVEELDTWFIAAKNASLL